MKKIIILLIMVGIVKCGNVPNAEIKIVYKKNGIEKTFKCIDGNMDFDILFALMPHVEVVCGDIVFKKDGPYIEEIHIKRLNMFNKK